MADRFWVGNGGNTNDTAHWSTTTGGSGGASVPTSADNAKFDANSFTLTGQVVTVNAAFSCLDMDWTGTTNTPTIVGSSAIDIYGSLTFINAMVISTGGTITLKATSTGKTITFNGVTANTNIIFNGVGGAWTLQDALAIPAGSLTLTNGNLNINGMTVTCVNFSYSNTNVRTLTLGTATIILTGSWASTILTSLTFSGASATIIMAGATKTFAGGGSTYGTVNITGTPITVSGSNTITNLIVAPGKTLILTSGANQTVSSLVSNGTSTQPCTIQAVTAASTATITLPASRYFIRHTSVKDLTISGATSLTDIGGTNVSGNTGITFVAKFEMGRIKSDGSFNWYSKVTGTVDKVSG